MGLKRLNTGEVGVPGTGDTVNAGGIKIRDSFDELYTTFGDNRLIGELKSADEEWITPHATGYFQHLTVDQIKSSPLKAGGMYDINGRMSPVETLVIQLPRISDRLPDDVTELIARRGESIWIQDSASSWYTNPIEIVPYPGDTIDGASNLMMSESLKTIVFTVVLVNGRLQWLTRVDDIDDPEDDAIIDDSIEVQPGVIGRIPIATEGTYDAMSFTSYVEEYDPNTTMTTNWSISELLVMFSGDSAYIVPYGTMETADLYTAEIDVQAGYVYLNIHPLTSRRLTVTLKSQAVIKRRPIIRQPVLTRTSFHYQSGGLVSNQQIIEYTTKSIASTQVDISFTIE